MGWSSKFRHVEGTPVFQIGYSMPANFDQVDWLMSTKFDGIRVTTHGPHLRSRGGFLLPYAHGIDTRGHVLDGELCVKRLFDEHGNRFTSSDVMHLVNNRKWSQLQPIFFDVVDTTRPFKDRLGTLDKIDCERVVYSKHHEAFLHKQADMGHEGVVMRHLAGPYLPHRRDRSHAFKIKF